MLGVGGKTECALKGRGCASAAVAAILDRPCVNDVPVRRGLSL
jgi:hypothetical protein